GHPAYIIYTSGSTGTPKGIVMPHRALSNMLAWQIRQSNLPGATTLQFSSLSFDVSIQEFFTTWDTGGTLIVPTAAVRRDVPALLALLVRHRVQRLFVPFVVLQALADAVAHGGPLPTSLRELVTAGEQLQVTPALVSLFERLPECVLENQYGPSEAHVVTAHRLRGPPSSWPRLPPVGSPLTNTPLYVLDAHGQLCPIGVRGDVFVGGPQLALGYHDRPHLTADRFVPNPFSREPGARLYRTGDHVRWRADGTLEYLGRLDGQVKVRGFRIEMGEVDAALREAPGVRDATALVREDSPGDKRLVGYVVLHPGIAWEPEALRQSLASRLPEYMVPSALVHLEALPLNPSGKLNRAQLPAPDADSLRGAAPFVAPRTPVEQTLADTFSAVLGLPRLSVTDNFFSMGGHSLLATQIVSRLRSSLGVELPLRALFEAPTVEALARRVEAQTQTGENKARAAVVMPRTGLTEAELSFAQQRLWFLDQYQPGTALYNMPAALRLEGALDVGALERAFTELVRRHEVLRTTFQVREGKPVQVVAPASRWALEITDLGYLPPPEREAEAMRLADEDARQPFDLARGPLLRTRLMRLGEQDHLLSMGLHHTISDGWSIAVLIRDMVALYEASLAGRPSPLPELPIQYVDYSMWQRDWLQGEVLEQQLGYWRKQLEGAPPSLELPTDGPRTADTRNPGASLKVELPPELIQKLNALCQGEGATLFMGLLAGLQTVLARYSGQDDICVGAPIAGRTQAQTEELVGFFVNTLVMRTRLDGTPTFRELLGRVKDVTLGAYANQDVPFEKLVEVLQPPRQPEHTPFFQVALVLLNTPSAELSVPGLNLRLLDVDTRTAKFDFTLTLRQSAQGLDGALEYRSDLFEASTAARMMEHLRLLLEDAVAHPEQRLSQLSLMSEAERHRVLVEWNATATGPSRPACVHGLFEAQASRTPDAVAVVFEGSQLTYAQLERRANQLAHALNARGVRPGDRVALCLERSLEMAVAVLAVLEAGAAYVPLDPAYPAERLSFMLEDAGVSLVLTQSSLASSLPTGTRLQVMCVDTEAETLSRQPVHAPAHELSPESACYVIYTSGSTGKPKGVALPHRALSNLLEWQLRQSVLPAPTTLQFASLSFDVSFQELFSTWCSGGTLVIPTAPVRQDMPALLAYLERHGVQRLFLPFVALQALADAVAHGAPLPTHLREVVTAGEQLQVTPALVALFERLPGCVLENQYGPSETHVVSAHRLHGPPASWPRLPPIGSPLPHTPLYVLDAQGQPCSVGVQGELFIGGVQLALGYHARPQLTAEKFVPNPFSREPGARLYRTGDRARWRADGTVEYLGRLDGQVKVRGFRIEQGEVEAALREVPGVRDAAALVREDSPGDKRLVGYVVLDSGTAWEPETLRQSLARRLPEYMVPSALVRLETLPLTPSGKLARRLLPAPDADSLRGAAPFVAPRTPVEQTLADTFSTVLGLPRLSVTDNFFSLGGHSLLATQIVSRLRSSLGVELPLRALFEAPTVESLARRVEAQQASANTRRASAPVIVPRSVEAELSFSQQRLWFLDQYQPGSAVYNMPAALRLVGALDAGALERAFSELVRRHQSLRTTFRVREDVPFQVIAPASSWRLEVTELGHLPASEREAEAMRLAHEDARQPFDLARGPLLRTKLLRLTAREHLLLVTMHHIVSDGWSLAVLIREVVTLYAAFSAGRPSPLPELPIQYMDFAAWQRDWLQGEVLDQQLGYWRKQLDGAPPTLELPTDRPRTPDARNPGASLKVELPPRLMQGLKALCQHEGATLFMGLLAGLQTVLARYSGQDDICVGAPIAGRTQAQTEELIGFFVNTLVLRTRLDGNPTFRELLGRVKDVTLGAYAHQDVPFEKLVEVLQPPRQQLGRTPFFQVALGLLNTPTAELSMPGLSIQPLPLDSGTARFDLSLSLSESAQGLSGELEYRSDLFEAATVARMMEHLRLLLEDAVAHPERRLSELSLMSEAERRRMLVEWNATTADFPREARVHELFEAQAARTPDAVAVVFEDQQLTYAELERRSRQLSHHLRALGVKPGDRVALCMERSLELMVGLLGILQAGAAYVPLDPSAPRERLGFMLEDTAAPVLLTREHLRATLPSFPGHLVVLDTGWETISQAPPLPPSGVTAGHPAYVLYTSGSTGQPKGALISHGALANHMAWLLSTFGLSAGERVLQKTPLSFDASVWECWAPLLVGAPLVLAPPEAHRDPAALVECVVRQRIHVLQVVPSLLRFMLDEPALARARDLRWLFCGGEALPSELAVRLRAVLPEVRLINLYGPTETTIDATWAAISSQEPVGTLPIGKPVANTQVYVLDTALRPVPLGVPGELYIGGVQLALGYLGRPALTAERFVPNPFGTEPGTRLYRTGDKVRWLPDGQLQFLGRIDFQVKVRGLRIEPGEVEGVLARHPAVREAVVVAREDLAGGTGLVAYVTARPGEALETAALRTFLRDSLPEYMVPAAFVVLDALPLTRSGKLDRRALPAPEAPRVDESHIAPRTDTERKLAGLWSELLGLEQVGVRNDFFELGGHSLLATRLLSRIRGAFQVELPLQALFEARTLEAQAVRVDEAAGVGQPIQAPALRPLPRR
ncbi:MAG TPA: amino acid adenylation domain-containing protein, partial [Archangium sp.]|nr:amino acid adenylation domain-containing protein [Archangium sp.]